MKIKHLLSGSLLALLTVSGLLYFSENPPAKDRIEIQIAEAKKEIAQINSKLLFTEISTSHDVFIENEKPQLKLRFDLKDSISGIHFFEEQKYNQLKTKDKTRFQTAKLCDVINSLKELKNPIIESIKELDIEVKASLFGYLDVNVANLENIVVELIYSMFKASKIKAKKIKILLRGYADKTKYGWSLPLEPKPYYYDTIVRYPVIQKDKGRKYNFNYSKIEENYIIDKHYSNQHLPNLRAKFIEDEFISTIIYKCTDETEKLIELKILDGKEFKDTENEKLRKVDIFIHFFFE